MLNIEDFIKRLEIILDYYSLNASSFADKIGVQRSSLSHLLSGRNKPSLDFILKIVEVYPDIDLYWILSGQGTFPKNTDEFNTKETIINQAPEQNIPAPTNDQIIPNNLFSDVKNTIRIPALETKKTDSQNSPRESVASEIDTIVIFYKNGSFKNYVPN